MGPMVLRELSVIGRRGALPAAICVHVALLAGYLLAWSTANGTSLDVTVYHRTLTAETLLLTLLLPWTAARCVASERGDDLVLLSFVAAMMPSRVILARAIAVTAALVLVVLSGLPVLIFAQRISALGASRLSGDELALFSVAMVSTAAALAWRHLCRGRVIGWLGAALSTAAVIIGFRLGPPVMVAPVAAGAACCAIGLLALRADVSLRYLAEPAE